MQSSSSVAQLKSQSVRVLCDLFSWHIRFSLKRLVRWPIRLSSHVCIYTYIRSPPIYNEEEKIPALVKSPPLNRITKISQAAQIAAQIGPQMTIPDAESFNGQIMKPASRTLLAWKRFRSPSRRYQSSERMNFIISKIENFNLLFLKLNFVNFLHAIFERDLGPILCSFISRVILLSLFLRCVRVGSDTRGGGSVLGCWYFAKEF